MNHCAETLLQTCQSWKSSLWNWKPWKSSLWHWKPCVTNWHVKTENFDTFNNDILTSSSQLRNQTWKWNWPLGIVHTDEGITNQKLDIDFLSVFHRRVSSNSLRLTLAFTVKILDRNCIRPLGGRYKPTPIIPIDNPTSLSYWGFIEVSR
jgi:hypothetical protein